MRLRVLEDDLGRLAGLLARDAPRAVDARRLVAALRRLVASARRPAREPGPLMRAFRIYPDDVVEECPLGCGVPAVVCVARQLQSEAELRGARRANRPRELARHDGKRGRAPTRPTCVSSRCALGASVRLMLGDSPRARAMAAAAPRSSDTSEG